MMKLFEHIDRLLTEGRLRDVSFDDVFGPKGRRTYEFDQLDHWIGEYWETIRIEIDNDLFLKKFKAEEIQSTKRFQRWATQEWFGNAYGYADELPEEYDWEELYYKWRTSGWGGFKYDGRKWRSAVDDFAADHDFYDLGLSGPLMRTETFMEIVRGWARDLFYDVVSMLELQAIGSDGRVRIWRAMTVKEDWMEHLSRRGKRLGEYWSWHKGTEDAHWAGSRGGSGPKPIDAIIQTSVDERHVNWQATIALNMDPSLGELEKEIRLFKNTPLKIERLWLDGKEVELPPEIKDKTFKA